MEVEQGSRKFYTFDSDAQTRGAQRSKAKLDEIASLIRENIVGNDLVFKGPFGQRKITYCDYIASGRSLKFIEDFISDEVLPHYGNTHTTTSVTSLQTTLYRHEARDILRNATGASEHDAVLFVGHGCTGAIHKLISTLKLNNQNVVVFVSRQEHHSNLLPWREIGAEIVFISETETGTIDLGDLEQKLINHQGDGKQLIGCFCAASNITGILNDDIAITALLHNQGALSFWDYATAAPYVDINVNPKVIGDPAGLCAKDAVYFSMHKFVGGVQTPGILIAKKALFARNSVPDFGGGGGSVFFVTEKDHKYLKATELREEAGTPAIVESIRAGMVMQLKKAVDASQIMERETSWMLKAKAKLEDNPNFIMLGTGFSIPEQHLPVISFMIRAPGGQGFLHHNFVCSVLNDVFGIQARGGCACSGPYAQHLLGMSYDLAKEYEDLLLEDDRLDRAQLRRGHQECSQLEILRPGFSRLNLPWFAEEKEIDFILDAVNFVANHGWKLMPQYIFNNETGEWKHHSNQVFKERKWLGNISYTRGRFELLQEEEQVDKVDRDSVCDFDFVMAQAEKLVAEAASTAMKRQVPDQSLLFGDEKSTRLRWMMLPFEAKVLLCPQAKMAASSALKLTTPFHPRKFVKPQQFCPRLGSLNGAQDLSLSYDLKFSGIANSAWLNMKQTTTFAKGDGPTFTTKKEVVQPEQEIQNNVGDCENGMCVLPNGKRSDEPEKLIVKTKWRPPTKDIFKPFLEAVEDFNMIQDGDRVLVCLSGGKDSLTLLHTMRQYQFYAKKSSGVSFDLGAITIDPQSSAYDPRPLIPYLKELGVPYLYEEQDIMRAAMEAKCSSICAFCSRMKRGRMYAAARRNKYNVLAMGQHLDDMAESFLMSVFHNGRLRTMKANYTVKEGDLRIVRPFAFVREKQLRNFAETNHLPVIPENCPACFESPKERHRTKQLLAQQELLFPRLYWSLKSAMYPVMNIRATGVESKVFGGKNQPDAEREEGSEDDEVD